MDLANARARLAQRREIAEDLRRLVKGEVRFDPVTCALYSTDASIYQMEPVGVVLPRDAEDVSAVVRYCWENRIWLLPRGGGTSLAGQAVNHAVVLDFSKYMNALLEVSPEEGWVRVQPGIVLDELNALLRPHGLMYAPDPSPSDRATVGGGIGNNSCGARSILYGKTLDQVLDLEVVLADGTPTRFGEVPPTELERRMALPGLEGQAYREVRRIALENREEIERRFPKLQRRVSGYNLDEFLGERFNLARMVVGSEGTLAVVTEARVRVVPRPRYTGVAVVHFHDLLESMQGTVELLEEHPSAIEMMDGLIIRQARQQPGLARRLGFLQGDPQAILAVEVFGDSPEEVQAKLDRVEARCRRAGLGYAVTKLADARQADVWAMRKGGLGLLMGIRGDLRPLPFVEDTAVDPARLPEYVARFDEIIRRHGTTAAYYGHASVGCLHIRPLINLRTAEGLRRMVRIAEEVADLVLEFGGSLSGEHGDGIVRGVFTEKMFGPRLYRAFQEVKRAFDPRGLLNPGKIIDCPPMTENLRVHPGLQPWEPETHLDFSDYYGFARAVLQCTGIGACRKTLTGVMCPSYMATRDEEHSTRGRANALRAVLTGLLPREAFTSERLYQVLDLCLECKACKTECESSVDMARIKAEFLAHYYRAHGVPLRARLFARVHDLSRWGSALAPLSNWLARSPLGRWAQSRVGIHPARTLPPFARRPFRAWFRSHRPHPNAGQRGRVVLFDDTFMDYHYPEVGISAVRLLERAGYEVVLGRAVCCGRPMVSKGLLESAREHARRNVDALYPYVEQGLPIVGCEPSCLLLLKDEYPLLLPGDQKARAVAESAVLLDTFLARLDEEGALDLPLRPYEGRVLFHGHCHQKALVGVQDSARLLRKVPRAQVEVLDAGCCGMAGSFGYEKEHYEVSMRIGELRLFPAVRALHGPGAVVVTGASCREQVAHGTGARPLHLAEFLAGLLEG